MMKKVNSFVVAASVLVSTGCTGEPKAAPEPKEATVAPEKVLIAYFSWGGNTKFAAEQIQKATGGTLFEIKPATPYPTDYQACVEQAKKEITDGVKPELADKLESIDAYDVIFVGSPNWWGTIAPPVSTFLTAFDFSGKTVAPFFTHGGGGMQNCEKEVQKLCEKATFLKAGLFTGAGIKASVDKITAWVTSIILKQP